MPFRDVPDTEHALGAGLAMSSLYGVRFLESGTREPPG